MLERVARLSDEIERMRGEERQQWIPVAEKLPEPETYILVSFDNYTLPDIAIYRVDDDGSGAFYVGALDCTYLSVGLFCECMDAVAGAIQGRKLLVRRGMNYGVGTT